MRTIDRLKVHARELFGARQVDEELREEMRFHVERQVEANLRAGMAPTEARRRAHLTFGHIAAVQETSRAARAGTVGRQLSRDLAYGTRLLRRAPAFAASSVLIVALGIGATTAMFSVLYGVLLKPLPYADPSRLVSVWSKLPLLGLPRAFVNGADHRDWQAANHVFDDIALIRPSLSFNLIGDGEPERIMGGRISVNLLPVLGVAPVVGRNFVPTDIGEGRDRVALLGYGLWKRRFGGDASIVGRTINLNGQSHTVVGVMPADFQYPGREYQIWTPLTIPAAELARREPGYNHMAVARLRRGVSLAQAQREMDTIANALATKVPGTDTQVGVEILPLLEDAFGRVRSALYLVFGAAACLLLISCLNLASLLSARAASRSREYAIRQALGASRSRLAIQALSEVTPVLVVGGVVGIAAAGWALAALVPLVPATLPRVDSIGIDLSVLAFSIAVLAVTGLAAALVPAMQMWRIQPGIVTREDGRSVSGGRTQSRLRNGLVVAQFALVLPLLVGASLLGRSFTAVLRVSPGFTPDNVLSVSLAIPRGKYATDQHVNDVCAQIVDSVAAVPGVASVGMVNRLPFSGTTQMLAFQRDTGANQSAPVMTISRSITPGYFETLGIPVIEGRGFTEHDVQTVPMPSIGAELPAFLVVDEQLARTEWPGQSAVGKRLRFPLPGAPWMEVIGVVGHIRNDGLDVDSRPQVYFNYRQRAQDRMAVVARGHGDVRALVAPIVQAIYAVDPEQPVYDVRTMDDVIKRTTTPRWLNMTLVAAFALSALVLVCVGLYGVVAYNVTRQTRDFGVRLALGSDRRQILRLVLRRAAILTLVGATLGLLLTLPLTMATERLLFGVSPLDPLSIGAGVALLFAIALVASIVPARRAASVDPAVMLRAE
jgi:putative ABC transport system permease protein